MNVVLKRRLIGAAVLVAAGILIPVILVKLAQPSAPPNGESVRVYEITPSGKARPVGEKPAEQNTPRVADNSQVAAASEQPSPVEKPDTSAAPDQPSRKSPAAAKPEAVAPQAPVETQKSEPAVTPKPKAKPELKPAPKPKPEPTPQAKPKPAPQNKSQTSKPAPASAEKPYYVVQIGSFGDESNAKGLVQKLQRDFPVYTRQGKAGGKDVYRVRVGPYDSREAADVMATRLRERGLKTQTMSLP